jgi:hypothetical protein
MRNPVFKEIHLNYRKRVLEITIGEGRKAKKYNLPFAVFGKRNIHSKNRFASISIDRELGGQAASLVLEDGSKEDFPADFVLYHCDPSYDWSPINQLKQALKDKLGKSQIICPCHR